MEFDEREQLDRERTGQKLDISEARVSKILKGDTNLTIDTIAKLACAVNSEVSLSIRPMNAKPETVDASNVYELMKYVHGKREIERGIQQQILQRQSTAELVTFSMNDYTACSNDELELQRHEA